MSAARKPVVVRNWTRDWCAGYAAAQPAEDFSELEVLDNAGKTVRIAWDRIKWVCYVRDLAAGDGGATDRSEPERLLRRKFTTRPRIPGLWLSLLLVDGDVLEGVAANDRSLIDGAGLMLTPPDTRSNTQRVYVPRSSIREMSILGVVSQAAPSRRFRAAQPHLFERDEQVAREG